MYLQRYCSKFKIAPFLTPKVDAHVDSNRSSNHVACVACFLCQAAASCRVSLRQAAKCLDKSLQIGEDFGRLCTSKLEYFFTKAPTQSDSQLFLWRGSRELSCRFCVEISKFLRRESLFQQNSLYKIALFHDRSFSQKNTAPVPPCPTYRAYELCIADVYLASLSPQRGSPQPPFYPPHTRQGIT